MALCPFRMIACEMFFAGLKSTEEGMYPTYCQMEECQWWDRGVDNVYKAGCGLIPRESRRIA